MMAGDKPDADKTHAGRGAGRGSDEKFPSAPMFQERLGAAARAPARAGSAGAAAGAFLDATKNDLAARARTCKVPAMSMTIQPYLFFDGNCAEAVEFYAAALGAQVSVQTFADAPMETPPEQASRVMHATIRIDDTVLFASDGMPGVPLEEGMRAHISVTVDDAKRGAEIFEALSAGGAVTMPFEKQFWGDTFGMLTDRFGVKWMVDATAES